MPLAFPKALRSAVAITLAFILGIALLRLLTQKFGHCPSPKILPSSCANNTAKAFDWSRVAYIQYVTNVAYLCNSVMIFEALHRLQSKPHRLMMYPSSFSEAQSTTEGRLLRKARDEYGVKLLPIKIQSRNSDHRSWSGSYTKLLAFNQTQYDRVLSLDSDATLLQPMDELFLTPLCPVAMPRAYWLGSDDCTLTSLLLLIHPSEFEFNRIMTTVSEAGPAEYDMEIMNKLYKDSALVLPHRPYALLTGEFRSKSHGSYLGNSLDEWDSEKILMEAKLVHFSDWPVPKPWISADPSVIRDHQPACDMNPETGQEDDCRSRDIWLALYTNFANRRKVYTTPNSMRLRIFDDMS